MLQDPGTAWKRHVWQFHSLRVFFHDSHPAILPLPVCIERKKLLVKQALYFHASSVSYRFILQSKIKLSRQLRVLTK